MNKDNIETSLKKLEDIDPSDEYAYEAAFLIMHSIVNLPILYTPIEAGLHLYRTRANENGLYNKISDISIPPNKCVGSFARCNRPFQSIFYGSESRETSFAELAGYWASTKKFGEQLNITVGRWVTTQPIHVIIVTTPDEQNRLSEFDRVHGETLDYNLAKTDNLTRNTAIAFYRFIFEKFRKPAKDDLKTYILTTAYSNYALFRTKGATNGIYYPSVPFGEQGVNFALNQDTAKNFLMLESVLYSEFNISENNQGKHSFSESKQIPNQTLDINNNLVIWN